MKRTHSKKSYGIINALSTENCPNSKVKNIASALYSIKEKLEKQQQYLQEKRFIISFIIILQFLLLCYGIFMCK